MPWPNSTRLGQTMYSTHRQQNISTIFLVTKTGGEGFELKREYPLNKVLRILGCLLQHRKIGTPAWATL
jgi:hypothetical protein